VSRLEQSLQVQEELFFEIRDALAHLYDSAYILRHPLLARLRPFVGSDSAAAVPRLRKLLVDVIEELRPPADTPEDDPAWRPYLVLWHRFIVGKDLSELEAEFALGKRQIQREQKRGLEAIVLKLVDMIATVRKSRETAPAEGPLEQEISRLAQEQEVVIEEQLRRAINSVMPLTEHLGVALEYCTSPEPLLTKGDPTLHRQLLVAILSHAAKSVRGGKVLVSLIRQRDRVQVVVRGIPGSGTTVEKLRLSEAIVALAASQRAEIGKEERDQYLILTISLPASKEEAVVAIVEDNEDVVALFSRYLSGQGYKLVRISGGDDALDLLAELNPDLVILDVMMRDLDGWELLQRFKANPCLGDTPVVICSVLNEPDLAAALGADACLLKPVRPAQLLDCLTGLLPSRRTEAAGL